MFNSGPHSIHHASGAAEVGAFRVPRGLVREFQVRYAGLKMLPCLSNDRYAVPLVTLRGLRQKMQGQPSYLGD